jgi:hypothetical protein
MEDKKEIEGYYSIDRYDLMSRQSSQQSKYSTRNFTDIGNSKIYKYLIFDFGSITRDFLNQMELTDNKMYSYNNHIYK